MFATLDPIQTLPLARNPEMGRLGEPTLSRETPQLSTVLDSSQRVVWAYMHAQPRPCFSTELLTDITNLQGDIQHAGAAIDYVVLASSVPNVFNLGGDLDLFHQFASVQDEEALRDYATLACQALHACSSGYGRGITSVAMIEGDALGGGLEAALSCQVIVAERGAKMGFPEVLFDLFPGMGAYSFVARRCGTRLAERLIGSGEILPAEKMFELGLVDVLAEKGEAMDAVQQLFKRRRHSVNGLRALNRARLHTPFHVPFEELLAVTEEWVQAATHLSPSALRTMERLVRAQNRLPH